MTFTSRTAILTLAIIFSLSFAAFASKVTGLMEFKNGMPAKAEDVNGNFNAIKTAVDDNYQEIEGLKNVRQGSVTYSALGFSPGNSDFEFNEDSFLTSNSYDGGVCYHSVGLRSGMTIKQIRALVYDGDNPEHNTGYIMLRLRKNQLDNNGVPNTVTVGSTAQTEDAGHQVVKLTFEEPIDWSDTSYPSSYFLEVVFSRGGDTFKLYSVTIDYEYTAP